VLEELRLRWIIAFIMKIAYFDCSAGAGGDMIVASLLDAGLDADFLKARLAMLAIPDLEIRISRTFRCGIGAVKFEPVAPTQQKSRHLSDINAILDKSGIDKNVTEKAKDIFARLARAEASVHGKDPDSIHFHELGAVDCIVDIVSSCLGLQALGIEKVCCSVLSVGGGVAQSAHGILPVPAPATMQLLKSVPIAGGPLMQELLTPTAAAVLTAFAEDFGPLPAITPEATGYGAGSIDSDKLPNVLRVIIGQTASAGPGQADSVCVLKATSDDTTAETVSFVTAGLLEKGALDVFTTPIYMKNNRPAVELTVICRIEDSTRFEQFLFEQGLTFGIRRQIVQRSKLKCEFVKVATEFGQITIKTGSQNGRLITAKPEFRDCAAAATRHKKPVKQIAAAALEEFEKHCASNSKNR